MSRKCFVTEQIRIFKHKNNFTETDRFYGEVNRTLSMRLQRNGGVLFDLEANVMKFGRYGNSDG